MSQGFTRLTDTIRCGIVVPYKYPRRTEGIHFVTIATLGPHILSPEDTFQRFRCRPVNMHDLREYCLMGGHHHLPASPIGCYDSAWLDRRLNLERFAYLYDPRDPQDPANWRARLKTREYSKCWKFAVVDLV